MRKPTGNNLKIYIYKKHNDDRENNLRKCCLVLMIIKQLLTAHNVSTFCLLIKLMCKMKISDDFCSFFQKEIRTHTLAKDFFFYSKYIGTVSS